MKGFKGVGYLAAGFVLGYSLMESAARAYGAPGVLVVLLATIICGGVVLWKEIS